MSLPDDRVIIWQPQPGPQTALISCPVFEVFFGGARGGGKTEGSLGDWLQHSSAYGDAAIGVFFRRKFKQLEEAMARARQIYKPLGAAWNEQKAEFTMPNGARLKFRYLERDSDAEEYQGHSYSRVYIEEATNFPSPKPIDLLRATLRSSKGIPTGMRLTGNPGGPGHNWVKKRFIDPNPRGYQILKEVFDHPLFGRTEMERIFIPSRLEDNALLMANDPTYVARLQQTGSDALVKAWLEGDWDIVDGAFFTEWDERKHVLSAKDWLPAIPRQARRFRAFDWGFARPFSVGWYVISDGTWGLPKNALLKYREWYGAVKDNEGLRMEASMVAEGIREREELGEIIQYSVADPAIFIRDGGPSIGEMMARKGVQWRRADNKRIPGWQQMRFRLNGEDGVPMLYFLDTCVDSIRTIPSLQHDDRDKEDLDTDGEDHAGDETRYACMSRPWLPRAQAPSPLPRDPTQLTINELIERQRKQRIAA